MKKKSPFTIVLDSHDYAGSLKLFTHTRLSIRLSDVTYVGLGRRGIGVRSAMAQQCKLNAKILLENDPNRAAEAKAAASAFFRQSKNDLSQLLSHQPLFGIKEGQKTLLNPDGQYVKLAIDGGDLRIDMLCFKEFDKAKPKPETWVVATTSDGRTFDIVARPGEEIHVGEFQPEGGSEFAEITVDQRYIPPQRTSTHGKPFNGIKGLPT